MVINDYNDMTVELMQATPYPAEMVALAMSITTKADPAAVPPPLSVEKTLHLIKAEHMSLFEHVNFTFLVQGISRSLLAQVTRQRTASITSGSQHYQDYQDYPMVINKTAVQQTELVDVYEDAFYEALHAYNALRAEGQPKEEARQVLPNASTVNILWTIDARNLFYFLRQRLCYRNVLEMRIFANRLRSIALKHFPELFIHAGPQCYLGKCHQGKLRCQYEGWTYERI